VRNNLVVLSALFYLYLRFSLYPSIGVTVESPSPPFLFDTGCVYLLSPSTHVCPIRTLSLKKSMPQAQLSFPLNQLSEVMNVWRLFSSSTSRSPRTSPVPLRSWSRPSGLVALIFPFFFYQSLSSFFILVPSPVRIFFRLLTRLPVTQTKFHQLSPFIRIFLFA